MFATTEDIAAVLGCCEELQAFFALPGNAALSEAHVLPGMQKTERSVFAPALIDGAVRARLPRSSANSGRPLTNLDHGPIVTTKLRPYTKGSWQRVKPDSPS